MSEKLVVIDSIRSAFPSSDPESAPSTDRISSLSSSDSRSPLITKDDPVEFLSNLMNKWTENNKEDLHLGQIELIPNVDYTINVTFENDIVEGIVNCKCGVRIKLRKRNDKLQLTNFYKHLRAPSCSMMREKKRENDEQNQLPNDIDSNDNNNNNMNDNQHTASQQPLSEITTNTSMSQRRRSSIISLSTTNSLKRNSPNLRVASSQQPSAKRHKK